MPRYFTSVFKVWLSHWIKLHKSEFHACPEYKNEAWLMWIYSIDCGNNVVFCVGNNQYFNFYLPVNDRKSSLQSRSVQGLSDFFELSQDWIVEPTSLFLHFMSIKEAIFSAYLLLTQWSLGDRIQQYTEADLFSQDL